MKKFVRVFFKTVLIIILILLVLIIVLPIIFKPQLMNLAKSEINKNVNATVEFADFKLNFIRTFPGLYVGMTDLSVVGIEAFEGDTLVAFKSFGLSVNPFSLFGDKGIEVRSILLDEPMVNALVLEDGTANWDIAKESAVEEVPDTTTGEAPSFHVQLKRFEIRNGSISYNDSKGDIQASLDSFNFVLRGDMTQDYTDLNVHSRTESLNLLMGGIRYLKDAVLSLTIDIGADLKNMGFTFNENEIALNELVFGFDGNLNMPGEAIETDLTFQTRETSFKTLLSLIPAIYMNDFQDLETSGQLSLNGYARGIYSEADSTLPDVGLELSVSNAMFKYPDLPKSVEDVSIDLVLSVDGSDLDGSTVDLNRFHLSIAENPVDAAIHLKTPVTDPEVEGKVTGKFNLASFLDIIPLEDISLKGLVDMNLELGGRMSMIENEQYEDFKADGRLALSGFEYTSRDLPKDVLINDVVLDFSPRFVNLSSFDVQIGESDVQLGGRLENFIPFIFKDETVSSNLDFTSSLLDLNELIPESEEKVVVEEDTSSLSVIEIPDNIDFRLTSALDLVKYDKIELTNIRGIIYIKDGKAVMEGLTMNLLEGSMALNGEYDTRDMTKPAAQFDLGISSIEIPSAFNTFNTVQTLMPVAKNLNGDVSVDLEFSSLLGSDMLPVIETINGYGKLASDSVQVVNSKTFDLIASALKLSEDRTNTLKNLNISFSIRDGRVFVDPFEASIGNIEMVIGGDQGLDQTMNYLVKMKIPRSAFGSAANQVIDDLAAEARSLGLNVQPGEFVNVDVNVGGTFTDPSIGLGMKESGGSAVEQVKEQLQETVKQEVEEKKEEVIEKIDEEAQRIIQQAEKEAADLIEAAKEAATKVIEEADASAKKLEDEAKGKGRIAELAAQRAADKLRSEAREKADKLVKEAEEQGDKIIQAAKDKVDGIKKD